MAENILVVDGEDAIHEIISSMLSSAGYQCRRVRNGLQAMALLDSGTQVDVILSEIMMPVMDGFALLIAVKQKYPHTPLAFVTSVRDRGVVDASINTGVCDYLIKPFNRDQLLTTVRRALSARSNPINERQLWARVVNEIDTATQTSGNKKHYSRNLKLTQSLYRKLTIPTIGPTKATLRSWRGALTKWRNAWMKTIPTEGLRSDYRVLNRNDVGHDSFVVEQRERVVLLAAWPIELVLRHLLGGRSSLSVLGTGGAGKREAPTIM